MWVERKTYVMQKMHYTPPCCILLLSSLTNNNDTPEMETVSENTYYDLGKGKIPGAALNYILLQTLWRMVVK